MTAAEILGIGRTVAYELVRGNRFPTPVIRVGHQSKIPTANLLDLLGLSTADSDGNGSTRCLVSSSAIRRGPSTGAARPQLQHRRLHRGRHLVRATRRPVRPVRQPFQIPGLIPGQPPALRLPAHPH